MKSEVFNKKRMNRCAKIHKSIMDNWRKTNRLDIVVRATESISGDSIPGLHRKYFQIGFADQFVEVPFIDVLVVLSMVTAEYNALMQMRTQPSIPSNFQVRYQVKTSFSDEETKKLFSGLRLGIESPFDTDKVFRVEDIPCRRSQEDQSS